MLKSKILDVIFFGVATLYLLPTVSAQDLYNHTFDGVANDSTPALQAFTNGAAGAVLPDLATGLISYFSSQGGGFNTVAPIDLSAESEFTIEFVVLNNSSDINAAGLNGSFFGLTSSPTSNSTTGTALFNNAGDTTGPAFGLQVGTGRGMEPADYAFDMVSGNGTFTAVTPDSTFTDDATDGYTVSVTYADNLDGTTNVTIATTGLVTDINHTVNEAIAYSSFSSAVTPNISSQGGIIQLASIAIKPATTGKSGLLGDVDVSGVVDFADIPAFIAVLQSGAYQEEADCDCSGGVDFADIPAFIAILQGG